MIGGSLMGTGGILAIGCTVGQGLSGLSTLAFASLLQLFQYLYQDILLQKFLQNMTNFQCVLYLNGMMKIKKKNH